MRVTTYKTVINEDLNNILVKERTVNYTKLSSLTEPRHVVDMLCDVFEMDRLAEEFLFVLALNNKNHLIAVFSVSHGTCNQTIASPREIMIRNLLCGASHFIVSHNHTSSVPTESPQDISFTKRLMEVGQLVGIPLQDHIIIGNRDNYVSLREAGIVS